ncbi:MAG: GTP cyclohydrolase I FolE [Muribaculaceae bacterium]|nr:GTP cyclohydrolase I FolE [Muribaculaceae bacterium]MBR1550951.1 GTP cyclohydrolase I FolE [Muribaculaceae bacterium]
MIKKFFDKDDQQLIAKLAEHYRAIIELIGEDPDREGLLKTPERAAKALIENTMGYSQDAEAVVRSAIFEHPGSEIVVVKDIEFYSLCEHHILPFFGTVSIGYIPDGSIVGLSKLARVVETYARRLQVQERMTDEICQLLTRVLSSQGVIVVAKAQHMCMMMRGVEKQHSATVTMQYSGAFQDVNMRAEFFRMLEAQK